MINLLPRFERINVSAPQQVRLTLREAAAFLGQSHRAVSRDCEFLLVQTYPNKGGCLSRKDLWELTVFVCWKRWKWHKCPGWRGDRSDYYLDWETDSQRYGYAMSRHCFDDVFDEYLSEIGKKPLTAINGELTYAA